jgi:hypothetical protein
LDVVHKFVAVFIKEMTVFHKEITVLAKKVTIGTKFIVIYRTHSRFLGERSLWCPDAADRAAERHRTSVLALTGS